MVGIERDVVQPGLFSRHDRLGANGVVLVEMEVEDVHLHLIVVHVVATRELCTH